MISKEAGELMNKIQRLKTPEVYFLEEESIKQKN